LNLLNQIKDHRLTIDLTKQAIAGEISEAEWREMLRPLLVDIGERTGEAAVNISDLANSVVSIGSHVAQATHGGHAEVNTRTVDQHGQLNVAGDIIFTQPAATSLQRDKNLSILLSNVRKIWVEDFLDNALLNAIHIDLGLQTKQDAVPQTFEELNIRLGQPKQPEQDLPAGTRAYDVYQQAQGSLLILGQPGSGKTTTLATLARDLLTEAEHDPIAPVPVIFNLSSWAAGEKPLAEWLEDELYHQYQVSRKLARNWLAEEQLALLLDGLDEVAEAQREACVAAINVYREHDYSGPLVVCSRLHDYEALQAKLNLGQAIVLKKLTRPEVEQYFQRLVAHQIGPLAKGDLLTLCEQIWRDEALRTLVETPLMLNIITVTYAHPQAPPLPAGEDGSLRTQIFEAYSERMFNRQGRTAVSLLHPKEQTLHYLGYLASQLQAHSLTQFSIGQIRGSWLPQVGFAGEITG
jgi:hypothetical protein